MKHAISIKFLLKCSEKPQKQENSWRDLLIFPSTGEANIDDTVRTKCSLSEVDPAKSKQEKKRFITLAGWSSLSYHMLRRGGNSL